MNDRQSTDTWPPVVDSGSDATLPVPAVVGRPAGVSGAPSPGGQPSAASPRRPPPEFASSAGVFVPRSASSPASGESDVSPILPLTAPLPLIPQADSNTGPAVPTTASLTLTPSMRTPPNGAGAAGATGTPGGSTGIEGFPPAAAGSGGFGKTGGRGSPGSGGKRAAAGTLLDLKQIGKYRLVRQLGKGGMGVVMEAEDITLGRHVAVKVLPENAADDPEALTRFLSEARAAARLTHPNTVAIYEIDFREGRHYIVMELVRGRSAGDAVAGANPMPWREATRVIADACRGLAAAHKAGLIHRDIKPANIMITEDGPAKLADFGLAKASGLGGVGSMAGPTGTGMVVGTPHYMSPEQAQAKPLDGRSDLYSLGATYLTLLTGRTPFPAEAPMQILYAHCTAPVPDPREVVPDLPDAAVEVVMRAMAKDPAERFPNAESMLAALEAVLSGEPSIQVEVLGAASFGRGATGGVSGLHGIGPAGPVTAPGLRAAATRRLPQPSRSGMSPAVAVACAVASAVAVVLVGVWAFGPRKTDKLADTKTPTPGQSTLASASGGTGGTNGTGGIGGTSTDPGTLTPIEPPPDVDPPRITRPDPRPTGKSGPRTGFGGNERPDPQPGPGPGPGPLTRPEYGPGPGPGLGPGPGFGPESGARASPESPPPPPPPAPPFRASHEAYDVVCFELARGNPGWRADGGDFWPRQGREMEGLVLPAEGLEMLAQLEWLTGLKSIKLTGSGGDEKRRVVRDVWFTRSMPQLESLDVSDTAVRFIGPVKDCKRLRWLKLTGTPVRDLTPLKGLPLEELDITDSQVSDLSPLKGMRLKLLWLGNTAVTDLSPLRGMKSLENLQFDGSKVRDLSPLEGLRLKVLWCQGLGGDGKAVSLDVLKTMPELTELSCDISSDADRELLRSLKSLRKLNDKPVEEALRK